MKHGGNNNSVTISHRNGKDCVVKSFGESEFELDKFVRELSFYTSCNDAQCKFVPELYDVDKSKRQIYLEKINSSQPVTFTSEFYRAALEFIGEINRSKNYFNYKIVAQENLINRKSLLNYLVQRYNQLESLNNYVPVGFDKKFKQTIQELELNFPDFGAPLINPSDIGVHNALYSEGRYYFIDFEYSGVDSFAKLAYDFYLHPANFQKLVDEITFFSDLSCVLGVPTQKFDIRIAKLFGLWWVLRLVNQLRSTVINEKVAAKIILKTDVQSYVEQRVKLVKNYWDFLNA